MDIYTTVIDPTNEKYPFGIANAHGQIVANYGSEDRAVEVCREFNDADFWLRREKGIERSALTLRDEGTY